MVIKNQNGQIIAKANGPVSANVHTPISGKVKSDLLDVFDTIKVYEA